MTNERTDIFDGSESGDEHILSLLSDLDSQNPDNTVLRIYHGEHIENYTARQLFSDTVAVGTSLVHMGLNGAVIAIVGVNSYNWITAYLGAVCAGGQVLVLDNALPPKVLSQQIQQAKATVLICDSHFSKTINIDKINNLILLDNEGRQTGYDYLKDLIKTGCSLAQGGDMEFARLVRHVSSISHMVFDSGAFGKEKAVMLSSRSLYMQVLDASDAVQGKSVLITESLFNLRTLTTAIATIAIGNTLCMSSEDMNVADLVYEFTPDTVLLSPQDAEACYSDIWADAFSLGIGATLEKKIKKAIRLAKFGIRTRRLILKYLRKNELPVANCFVIFGNNINKETAYGLHMCGIDVLYCYYVPECGYVSYTVKSDGKNTTLGKPSYDNYVKLNEFGQILVKANSTMSGYLREGTYPDHWIPTGDTGVFSDGRIVLQNDPQSVYITGKGRRVFPGRIGEMVRMQIPYASEISVKPEDGELTLYISFDANFMSINGKEDIRRTVETSVRGLNGLLSTHERITSIVLDELD